MTKEVTYEEYIASLNNAAIGKSMENMIEMPSLDEAVKGSNQLEKTIKRNMQLPKGVSKKPTYAIAQIRKDDTVWIASLLCINGAHVLLRATNPETKKSYIPSDVWMMITVEDPETGGEVEDLALLFSIEQREVA